MDNIDMLKWRESQARSLDDQALADGFAQRAAEVRQEVEFLLAAGLTEGASEALTAVAEQDMVDFSIMVDLTAAITIDGVEPLSADTRTHLEEFLDEEPWHSLAIDLDITVVLAMIEDVLQHQGRWYETSPQLPLTLATLMDRVNREQFQRFAAELHVLKGNHEQSDSTTEDMIHELVQVGARRVGVNPRIDQ
jgi:hypothetical protein